ncbi:50S ribosomal protein L11 methyltransferase [Fundicoccus culcitae]|uniref:Ribosomal protein L11 methyltransferase n=1 Tax=Fundicoccus culcitae TaxID=2969821 RepID=A0ABY5P6F4_9LACT|nr:50S ribosomal protein L11 methyltransferase [Fundicoccus culcitae]UUX34327.1 50S ribosomal protein L11 methyltransferase [Fundicoccus culcitae]
MVETYYYITITSSIETSDQIDLVSHVLFEAGALGTQVSYAPDYLDNHPDLFGEIPLKLPQWYLEHATEVEGYFDTMPNVFEIKHQLQEMFPTETFNVVEGKLDHENWHKNWMKYYQPEHISRFLTIVPSWQSYEAQADELIVRIDPGLAFGTGNHPTTRLSAQALELYLRLGDVVYDVGTGSGILSFVADKLGASHVIGLDLDPQAVESANNNLDLQQEITGSIEFKVNDLLNGMTQKANLIVANILPHILVKLLDDALKLLHPGGYLILGGILLEKAESLLDVIRQYDQLELIQRMEYKNWVNIVVQLKVEDA